MDFPLFLAVLNWTQWQKHSNAHEIFNSEQQQQANEKNRIKYVDAHWKMHSVAVQKEVKE